jgi:hypothetical protein
MSAAHYQIEKEPVGVTVTLKDQLVHLKMAKLG